MLNVINSSCCIFLLLQNNTCSADENLMVYLGGGTVKGLKANDGDYYMYLGIPYAKVDDNNHFGAAISYTISDIFEAYDDSILCPQVNQENNTIVGTIDCLRLNIYVPTTINSTNTLLPVMLWVHGGLFHHGFAGRYIFGPRYLVEHEVIIVTINYRIGPYGFMCLDVPQVSGNQGLKDQYLAIKWVKDNIESFGGDPNQITLFGQGAGAHSIDLHLLSNRQIFFKKIILQSGSAQTPTILNDHDKLAPLKMSRYIGFETDDLEKALTYLSNISTNLVITAAVKLDIQFKPCVETLYDNVEPFIENTWINADVPKIKNMSVLIGFTKLEMAKLISNYEYFNDTRVINNTLTKIFNFDDKITEMNDLVTQFYLGDEELNNNMKWSFIRFASDFIYIHPVHRSIKKYLENKAKRVYLYMFSYVGRRNSIISTDYDEFNASSNLCCASHSDDLSYLFDRHNKPAIIDEDQLIMKRMTTMWTNFAKYGNPTPAANNLLPVEWKPVTKSCYYYLDIDTMLTLGKRPFHDRMAFWDLFYTHNMLFQRGYDEE